MRIKLLALGITTLAAVAAIPTGYDHWTSGQLQDHIKKLGGKEPTVTIGSFGNHSVIVARRDSSGEAEIHEGKVDIMFIQAGEADIVIGGTVPDAKTTAPGELRGSKIEGGERQTLRPGDIVHIPARTPHQMLIEPGHKLDYYTVKVAAK
jgi:mannose-6-phosphate isomerase-like protein (cupin superfamily)